MKSYLFSKFTGLETFTIESVYRQLSNVQSIVDTFDEAEGNGGQVLPEHNYGCMMFKVGDSNVHTIVSGGVEVTVVSSEREPKQGLLDALKTYYDN